MSKEPKIKIKQIWEDNLKKLNEQKGFSLIRIYKKNKFKYAIKHHQDLVDYETLEPEEKSITTNPTLKGIPKILMKKRVEAMHPLDYTL